MNIKMAEPKISEDEIYAVVKVLKSGKIAHGEVVEQFETNFANYVGTKYAVACNNGTSALHMALIANGVKKGDEVITTPFSFIASANAILMCGAKPIFVDIDKKTFNIDVDQIEEAITPKTKAIMPVHLFGQSCDMSSITVLAKKYNIAVIEDACQAHGATWQTGAIDSSLVGSFGTGCFSLYPTKNIFVGEGGLITTNDDEVYNKLLMIRNHGQSKRYHSEILGYNYRMTNISAAIGIEQLSYIELVNFKRVKNAQIYDKELGNIKGIETPYVHKKAGHVYNQYTIKVTDEFGMNRNELRTELNKFNISSEIYYPILMPEQKHIAKLGYSGNAYENALIVKNQVLSIPIHDNLTHENVEYVAKCIKIISESN